MHYVQMTGSGAATSQEIWVGEWVDDGECCVPQFQSGDMYFVGAQSEHPEAYNGTLHVTNAMQDIARDFRNLTGRLLCVNDMSLNWGGIFDLGPRYPGGSWWNGPHAEHRKGLNADLPFSCLDPYRQVAYNIALQYGGGDGPGGILTHSDHYHLRFSH